MKIAKYIKDNIKNDRLLVRYGDVNNQEIMGLHKGTNKPTVLVSSSMLEGVDLIDDLSRWQVFVKMPWTSLEDKRTKVLSEKRENWYLCQTMRALIQGAGRSTRSVEDSSMTYIIDKSFSYWYSIAKQKGMIPEWFKNRVILS